MRMRTSMRKRLTRMTTTAMTTPTTRTLATRTKTTPKTVKKTTTKTMEDKKTNVFFIAATICTPEKVELDFSPEVCCAKYQM